MEEKLALIEDFLLNQGVEVGLLILKGLVVLIIGLQILKFLSKGFVKILDKRDVDPSLKPFLKSLFHNALLVMLILSVLGTIGIPMTSFVAIVGAAGLAIGLALQGTLQNFAGGVIILILRPFRVGDFIDTGSHAGTVREIQVFNTIMMTPDNVKIIIPNGVLSNGSVKNFSTEETRRIDMVFGIGYGDDIKKAKEVLESILKADERILEEPAPTVAVSELADSSVNFVVRPWVKAADYWAVKFDTHEKVKLEFDEQGISIPFPQTDVHIHKEG